MKVKNETNSSIFVPDLKKQFGPYEVLTITDDEYASSKGLKDLIKLGFLKVAKEEEVLPVYAKEPKEVEKKPEEEKELVIDKSQDTTPLVTDKATPVQIGPEDFAMTVTTDVTAFLKLHWTKAIKELENYDKETLLEILKYEHRVKVREKIKELLETKFAEVT